MSLKRSFLSIKPLKPEIITVFMITVVVIIIVGVIIIVFVVDDDI